jgi:hypothetical protein
VIKPSRPSPQVEVATCNCCSREPLGTHYSYSSMHRSTSSAIARIRNPSLGLTKPPRCHFEGKLQAYAPRSGEDL